MDRRDPYSISPSFPPKLLSNSSILTPRDSGTKNLTQPIRIRQKADQRQLAIKIASQSLCF